MRCGKDNFIQELEGIFNVKNLEENNNIVFTFSSMNLGGVEKELGYLLMETYLHTLADLDFLPKTIILYNEAVLFAISSSKLNIYFRKLQSRGVEILLCSTSTRYYQIDSKINIGQLTSMKTILEKKMSATKLIVL
ncbi:MAG: hypothetical protein Q4A58_04185 [Fusobacterium sp.]|uniref:hypothetical protein n=1 Tax=Fusobacterium sp. TaxID=68766 RepID=UPI0026DC11A7|nr:hypothetical protein [Fusobacterium sp.]MDO4690475.1 hypothetical protein [Fusobacterium sp.]